MMPEYRFKKIFEDNPGLSENFIQSLIDLETKMGYPKNNIRDSFTGLIADEVFKGKVFVKELTNGMQFKFNYNSRIAREFLLSTPRKPNHVWEPQTTKTLLHFSADAQNVIVGGAYFGDHALLIADKLKGNGICHTFEPNTDNCSMIEENARLNNISNIRINRTALWTKSGEKLCFEGEDALASTVPASADASFFISTVSLDDYILTNAIENVELLMVDVEGSEMKIFEGASEMFKKNSPVVVFESHSLHNDWSDTLANSDSVKFLRDRGYYVFSIRDFHNNRDTTGMKVELIPVERTYTDGPPHGFNLLAIKDRSQVDADLFRIVYDYSPKLLLHKTEKEFLPSVN